MAKGFEGGARRQISGNDSGESFMSTRKPKPNREEKNPAGNDSVYGTTTRFRKPSPNTGEKMNASEAAQQLIREALNVPAHTHTSNEEVPLHASRDSAPTTQSSGGMAQYREIQRVEYEKNRQLLDLYHDSQFESRDIITPIPSRNETKKVRTVSDLNAFKLHPLSLASEERLAALPDNFMRNGTGVPPIFEIALVDMGVTVTRGSKKGLFVLSQENEHGEILQVERTVKQIAKFLQSKNYTIKPRVFGGTPNRTAVPSATMSDTSVPMSHETPKLNPTLEVTSGTSGYIDTRPEKMAWPVELITWLNEIGKIVAIDEDNKVHLLVANAHNQVTNEVVLTMGEALVYIDDQKIKAQEQAQTQASHSRTQPIPVLKQEDQGSGADALVPTQTDFLKTIPIDVIEEGGSMSKVLQALGYSGPILPKTPKIYAEDAGFAIPTRVNNSDAEDIAFRMVGVPDGISSPESLGEISDRIAELRTKMKTKIDQGDTPAAAEVSAQMLGAQAREKALQVAEQLRDEEGTSAREFVSPTPESRSVYKVIDSITGDERQKNLALALSRSDGTEQSAFFNAYLSPVTQEYFTKKFLQKSESKEAADRDISNNEFRTEWEPELISALNELGIDTSDLKEGMPLMVHVEVPDKTGKGRRVDSFEFTPARATRFVEGTLGLVQTKSSDVEIDSPRDAFGKDHERLTSKFGLTEEWLHEVPGFSELSQGQQQLVFLNLEEYVTAQEGSFLRDAWDGFMSRTLVFSESRSKNVLPNAEKYAGAVAQLVAHMLANGPKKFHKEKGSDLLLPDLVGIEYDRENRKHEWEAIKNLNSIAHRLAKMPASSLEDGIGTHAANQSKLFSFIKDAFSQKREQYNKYQEVQKSYEIAKNELASVFRSGGMSEGEIAGRLIEIDGRLSGLQFIQTSPDEVSAIQKIPDPSMWQRIGKSLTDSSNLGYMAAGFGIRAAATSLGFLNLAVAPAISAAIAGTRAWNKTAAELRERDRAARAGVIDTAGFDAEKQKLGEALNIIEASQMVEQGGIQREYGATQKLQDLVERFKSLEYEGGKIEERSKVFEQLQSRAQYMLDKQKLNRINFGTPVVHARNMAKFFETLAEAHVLIADNQGVEKSRTLKRLEQYLTYRENAIQGRRRALQTKKLAWNALRAGTFATAGALLADYVRDSGIGKTAIDFVKAKFQGTPVPSSRPSVPGSVLAEKPGGAVIATPKEVPPSIAVPQGAENVAGPTREAVPVPSPEYQEYVIKPGDTLTKILKEEFPQNTRIPQIINALTREELQSIGVRGNANLIYAGETINLEQLHKLIEEKSLVTGEQVLGADHDSPKEGDETVKVARTNTLEGTPNSPKEILADLAEERIAIQNIDEIIGLEKTPDLLVREKTWAIRDYIVDKLFNEKEWSNIKNHRATEYFKELASDSPAQKTLNTLVASVTQSPYNLRPFKNETISMFLLRVSLEIAKRENQGKLPPELRKIFQNIESSDTLA